MDNNFNEVEKFYDEHTHKFMRDYVYGNERVKRQYQFLEDSIPENARNILVVGGGLGEVGPFVASIAKCAKVLVVDISGECNKIASKLFNHKRVFFKKVDVINENIDGKFDVIIFPDVYEHIPIPERNTLHLALNSLLNANGKILITCPSPSHQVMLHEQQEGLQVIDEIVTLEDFIKFADDVDGIVTFFRIISVWNNNDYIHAMIERGANRASQISEFDKLPVKGWENIGLMSRIVRSLKYRSKWDKLQQSRRRRHLSQARKKLL